MKIFWNEIASRATSFGHAFRGLKKLISSQPNARIHCIALVLVCALGYYLNLTAVEWSIVTICIGITLTAEAMNTALEFLADEVSLEIRERIGTAKDIAAAGVLCSSLASAVVGIIIFYPHILNLFRG